jgi:hypothetical protein
MGFDPLEHPEMNVIRAKDKLRSAFLIKRLDKAGWYLSAEHERSVRIG